jgi:predicted GTPase
MATPVDLRKFTKLNKPAAKIDYELEERFGPSLQSVLKKYLKIK